MTTYVFLVWQTYFVFYIYTNNFGNCTHVYNAHEVLCQQPEIFYIYKPCLWFHIYDPLSIPSMAVIVVFFFANAYHTFTVIHKISYLTPIFVLHIYDQLWFPCLANIFLHPYFFQHLLKLYTHVYIFTKY